MWHVDDITLSWLKVRNDAGRIYFIPWTQDPAILSDNVLSVIPSDPAESARLTLTIPAADSPVWGTERVVSPALRCEMLASLWFRERRKLEDQGSLESCSVWIQR